MKIFFCFFRNFIFITWLILWGWFRYDANATEQYYSSTIYPIIAKWQNRVWSGISISMGDIFYTLFILYSVFFVVRYFPCVWKRPIYFFKKTLQYLMIIFVLFFSLWGFNYFRKPLSSSYPSSSENFEKAIECIIEESNWLHEQLATADSLKVVFPYHSIELYEIAQNCYPLKDKRIKTQELDFLGIKPSLYSHLLSYMGFSGYLNPFTGEAQINEYIVGYSKPHTICHEIAHQMGYAAENEANFIGFVAGFESENPYFRYSASLFALKQLLAEVRKDKPELYETYLQNLRKGIIENYKETHLFWQQFQNKAEPFFKTTYNAFLKANKQKDGIESYSKTTQFLVHYLNTKS